MNETTSALVRERKKQIDREKEREENSRWAIGDGDGSYREGQKNRERHEVRKKKRELPSDWLSGASTGTQARSRTFRVRFR